VLSGVWIRHFGFALVIAVLPGLTACAEPQSEDPPADPLRISVNVDLVVLQATVRDRGGHLVSDLSRQNFEVYEDRVRQSIRLFQYEDVPVTVGLVIDHSGSMRPKIPDVIAAARTFVRASNPEDRMFVVNFNEKVTLGLPVGTSFTDRADELERAIGNTPAVGQTALYDAVVEGLGKLQSGGPEKKVLIVISDGGDNASAFHLPEILKRVEQSSAVVYTVGIFDEEDPDRNPGVLTRLARSTGGEAFFPARTDEVVAICERIARDIRNQYTIGYLSNSTAPPGATRTIRMVARAAGKGELSVRTRSGYMAGGAMGTK
jgi:Ca-activated chloride channel family protein